MQKNIYEVITILVLLFFDNLKACDVLNFDGEKLFEQFTTTLKQKFTTFKANFKTFHS